jgi:FkbH-like protein
MTLREDDFVRIAANWRPKHENLAELADALNLGVDSCVFVDDSPYEVGLVREKLPGVAVVHVDGDPALHVERLLRDGWFDTRELTAEDRGRVAKYRDELARQDFLAGFDSIQDYLRELKVTVRLGDVADREVPRVAQLTQRTNQFNLTTRRLQQPEVRALRDDPASLVLAIHAGDRFGDNGLVGAVFARRDGDALHIDNYVLSCRVFSRGIEQACLAVLLDHARAAGATAVYGYYRPTARNGIVGDLYRHHGFSETDRSGDGTAVFRHDLSTPLERPEHLTVDVNIGGGAA